MATYQGTFEDSNGNVLLNTPHSYAYIESGTTATRSYAKGDLLVFKNQLCQANAAISTGATLTIGGNVLATSVASQLSNINVYVDENDKKLHFVDHAGADTVLPFSSGKGLAVITTVGKYYNCSLVDPENGRYLGNGWGGSFSYVTFPPSSYPNRVSIEFEKASSVSSTTYKATIRVTSAGYYLYGITQEGTYFHYHDANETIVRYIDSAVSNLLIAFYTDVSAPNT